MTYSTVKSALVRRLALVAFGLLWSTASASAQLPQVFYLPFDEGAGTSTADIAVPGLAGTNAVLTNANNWNLVDPYLGNAAWEPGQGVLDIIDLGTGHASTGGFTFEFALYPSPDPNALPPRMDVVGDNSLFAITLLRGNDGQYSFRFGSSPVNFPIGPAIPLNQWTFVSIVYEPILNLVFLYFDGMVVDSLFPPFSPWGPFALNSSGFWQIGRKPFTSVHSWEGSIDEFRVWNTARSPGLVRLASKVNLINGGIDVGAGDILVPPRRLGYCQYYSTTETLTVEVCNPGLTPIIAGSAIPLTASVDGQLMLSESVILASDLNPGDFIFYTFAGTLDLSPEGLHIVRIETTYPGDSQPANNAFELDFRGGGPGVVSEFPWLETFDNFNVPFVSGTIIPSNGWNQRQGELDAFGNEEDWGFFHTPSPQVPQPLIYPDNDHTSGTTSGVYATSGFAVQTITLESPCIELFGLTKPTLSFYYNLEKVFSSSPNGQLEVEVQSVTLGTTTTVFGPVSSNGPDLWQLKRIDLTPWLGQTIHINFRGSGGNTNMVSIDDVSIFDEVTPQPGQAPRLMLATLDISGTTNLGGATNANVQEVTSGEGGPYRKTAYSPSVISFDFEGLPLQPILLISGDLNVTNATYGTIGQMDIGGPLDPASGVPANLVVWGNGFAPVNTVDNLFYTDATGSLSLQVVMPLLTTPTFPTFILHGTSFGTFQALMALPTAPYVALSNAVELVQW